MPPTYSLWCSTTIVRGTTITNADSFNVFESTVTEQLLSNTSLGEIIIGFEASSTDLWWHQPSQYLLIPQWTKQDRRKAQLTIQIHSYTLSCLQLASFYRWRLRFLMTNIHLLFISRPLKQVNHSFPRCIVSLNQMKEPRTEYIHLSRRTDSNLLVARSKTSLKKLSIIFEYETDKFLVRIGKRIADFFTESHSM